MMERMTLRFDEGGNPVSPEEGRHAEMMDALGRIEKLLLLLVEMTARGHNDPD